MNHIRSFSSTEYGEDLEIFFHKHKESGCLSQDFLSFLFIFPDHAKLHLLFGYFNPLQLRYFSFFQKFCVTTTVLKILNRIHMHYQTNQLPQERGLTIQLNLRELDDAFVVIKNASFF